MYLLHKAIIDYNFLNLDLLYICNLFFLDKRSRLSLFFATQELYENIW